MENNVLLFSGVRVFVCDANGPRISNEADVNDLIGSALGQSVDMVAVPVERLTEEFLKLRTRFAGLVVQKFTNYRLRLAVIGDIEDALARSQTLQDFVAETNRGAACWFVNDMEDLEERLRRSGVCPSEE